MVRHLQMPSVEEQVMMSLLLDLLPQQQVNWDTYCTVNGLEEDAWIDEYIKWMKRLERKCERKESQDNRNRPYRKAERNPDDRSDRDDRRDRDDRSDRDDRR